VKALLGTAKRVAEGGSSPRDGLVEPTNRKFTARLSESVGSGKKLSQTWIVRQNVAFGLGRANVYKCANRIATERLSITQ
jgi:hypothetical protein